MLTENDPKSLSRAKTSAVFTHICREIFRFNCKSKLSL